MYLEPKCDYYIFKAEKNMLLRKTNNYFSWNVNIAKMSMSDKNNLMQRVNIVINLAFPKVIIAPFFHVTLFVSRIPRRRHLRMVSNLKRMYQTICIK